MFDKEYERVLALVDSEQVGLATSFKSLMHKELCLGQTRYVCRYGTLSDGHERITDAQRYYGAIKEMYSLSGNIRLCKASAMLAQADLLDAKEEEANAVKESDRLRALGKALQAQEKLLTALVTVEDQLRQLDEYDQVRKELMPTVTTQYPNGIEQAEPDNWRAVYEYRMLKEQTPGIARERTDNIPLNPVDKAMLGYKHGRLDSVAPLAIGDTKKQKLIESAFNRSIEQKQEVKQ